MSSLTPEYHARPSGWKARPTVPLPLRRALWLAFLLAWTAALVLPAFVFPPRLTHAAVARIPLGKILHVGCYALLAAAVPAVVRNRRAAWLVLAGLSLHTFGTEFVQAFVPTRGPSLFDVGLDHLGLVAGVALTACCWNAVFGPRAGGSCC